MEFISQHSTSLFQGIGFLGLPVDFDMDPAIKPLYPPIYRQLVSKQEKLKVLWTPMKQLYSSSESPIPQIGYQTWLSENGSLLSPSQEKYMCVWTPAPLQTLNKAVRQAKYIIPTLDENLHKLHSMRYMTDRHQGGI